MAACGAVTRALDERTDPGADCRISGQGRRRASFGCCNCSDGGDQQRCLGRADDVCASFEAARAAMAAKGRANSGVSAAVGLLAVLVFVGVVVIMAVHSAGLHALVGSRVAPARRQAGP
jgi:hypothetical protein